MPALTKNRPALDASGGVAANRPDEFRERDRGRLRAFLLAGAVVAILIGLYARVLPAWLKDLWNDPTYGHAFIVPIISGFVIWQRRRALAALPIRGSWRGLPLLLA